MSGELGRRAFGSLVAAGAVAALARPARAHGRTPTGGSVALHLPWPLATVDPHRLDDMTAAVLGGALFDSLYTVIDGAYAPVLAEAEPEPQRGGLRIAVRTGLRTARDRPIDARDALASIARARTLGARGWLAEIPPPRLDGHDALVFPTHDAAALLAALASPLVAVVPSAFSPERPDGTGPFAAQRRDDALALVRNPRAASGPAFVDEVVVRPSSDLAASLRAFETGEDAIGWLGSGLHEPRAGAKPFDFGTVGWALLRTGRDAAAWDAPGVAQRLADGIPFARLSYLQLGGSWPAQEERGWGGPATDLLVRDDSPWLVELARAVAATLSRPDHALTVRPSPAAEIAGRRASRSFALMIDAARVFSAAATSAAPPTPLATFLALSTADDPTTAPDVARHAPRLVNPSARALTRTMRVGVLGEIRVQGAHAPDLALSPSSSGGIDFGDAWRARAERSAR